MKKTALFLAAIMTACLASAAIKTETVTYKIGTAVFDGYLAYDDATKDKRPGILVVHEWTGLNDFTKKKTEDLAALGYVAFAADIYGRGVRPSNPEDAGKTSSIYKNDRNLTRGRMFAALDILKKNPLVDTSRLGAMGFCFGGMCALELARAGAPLKGVVAFHGDLSTPTPEDAKNIKGKVLALQGGDDPFVTLDQRNAFMDEMRKGKVDWELVQYGGTVHSFTNPAAGNDPSKGAAYNKESTERAWTAMQNFWTEVFAAAPK